MVYGVVWLFVPSWYIIVSNLATRLGERHLELNVHNAFLYQTMGAAICSVYAADVAAAATGRSWLSARARAIQSLLFMTLLIGLHVAHRAWIHSSTTFNLYVIVVIWLQAASTLMSTQVHLVVDKAKKEK